MKKIISYLVLATATSLSFGDGTFHSTTKTTGAYIPIKAEASGTWQMKEDNIFQLLGSRNVSGGFGLIKANLVIRSTLDKNTLSGNYTVLECTSTGWVNVCDSIQLQEKYLYNSVDFQESDAAKFEIKTVFDDGDQVTREHTFLLEE